MTTPVIEYYRDAECVNRGKGHWGDHPTKGPRYSICGKLKGRRCNMTYSTPCGACRIQEEQRQRTAAVNYGEPLKVDAKRRAAFARLEEVSRRLRAGIVVPHCVELALVIEGCIEDLGGRI